MSRTRPTFKHGSILLGAAAMVAPALATPPSGPGYSGTFHIVEYHLDLDSAGAWNLWIKGDQLTPENPSSCANSGFYVLPMNYAYSKERYAAILSAFTAGKSIEVYVGGPCYGTGSNSYPMIDQARFKISD